MKILMLLILSSANIQAQDNFLSNQLLKNTVYKIVDADGKKVCMEYTVEPDCVTMINPHKMPIKVEMDKCFQKIKQ